MFLVQANEHSQGQTMKNESQSTILSPADHGERQDASIRLAAAVEAAYILDALRR
jgi:hypothetical protein